jgi:hypothetical protein
MREFLKYTMNSHTMALSMVAVESHDILTTNINYNEVIIIASLNEMAERCTE